LGFTCKGANRKPGNTLERGIGKKFLRKRGIIEYNSISYKELHVPTTRKRDQKEGSAVVRERGITSPYLPNHCPCKV
jgi:hypothetical protein